ncbi:MAG: Gfo/Idh/MocA family oxidoreductase [Fimbriimonadaceae bacterium]|nr:Gfo/Idh/MocA family oxidoreductase [Fimbriimonadaceae bacterium]
MKRREFLKGAAAAGITAMTAGALSTDIPKSDAQRTREALMRTPQRRGKSVAGYADKPMDRIRTGHIGVGARGPGHLAHALVLDGVEVTAICDIHKPSLDAAVKRVTDAGRPAPRTFGNGEDDFMRMLEMDNLDVVYIATPWQDHARMAIAAMKAGKHALVEVPLALTIEEMWDIVSTAEETQRHCMMLENVNYGREELLCLHMCRLGLFGDLLHAEGAYIHDLRGQMFEVGHGTGSWRTLHYAARNGNLYPTHGLGPIAQYMNICRGDRFDYMSSVGSPSRARAIFAKTDLPDDNPHKNLKFVCGDINTTIIKTVLGRSLMVQWDEQLPRPYNRLNLIQGTNGVWGGFPNRFVLEGETPNTDSWVQGGDLTPIFEKYEHPLWKRMGEEAQRNGGHGGMDFIMNWRVMTCLREGQPLDQNVYEGAAWSAVSPLSEWSVANRGQSIDFPDFTRGEWAKTAPLGIVS